MMSLTSENQDIPNKKNKTKNKIYLNVREAAKCCNDALIINPKNLNSLYVMGKCLIQQDNLGLLKDVIEKIKSIDQKHLYSLILEGHVLLKNGQIVESYDKFLRAFLNSSTNDAFLFYGLGLFYEILEKFELSREWYTLILSEDIELHKYLEIMYRIGVCYKKEGKFTDALGVFKRLEAFVKFDSLQDDVNLQIAHVYELTNNTESCIKLLNKLMVSGRIHILANRLYNWIYFKNKNYELIKNQFKCQKDIESRKDSKVTFKNIQKELEYCDCNVKNEIYDQYILYLMGRVLAEEGKYDDSLEVFLLCIKLDPMCYLAYNSAGIINFKIKKYEAAQKLFQQALVVKSYYSDALNNLKVVDCKIRKKHSNNYICESDPDIFKTNYIDSQVIFNEQIFYANFNGVTHLKDLFPTKFKNL